MHLSSRFYQVLLIDWIKNFKLYVQIWKRQCHFLSVIFASNSSQFCEKYSWYWSSILDPWCIACAAVVHIRGCRGLDTCPWYFLSRSKIFLVKEKSVQENARIVQLSRGFAPRPPHFGTLIKSALLMAKFLWVEIEVLFFSFIFILKIFIHEFPISYNINKLLLQINTLI